MRIALIDNSRYCDWLDNGPLFGALVAPLRARGHDVVVLDASSCGPARVLTGCARERDALPLIAATRVATELVARPPELCLFSAQDGLAHGTLMARACGELPDATRIVLWQPPLPPRDARESFGSREGLREITAGAMRRYCATTTDRVIEPSGWSEAGDAPALFADALLLRTAGGAARELVFCGPFTRASGFVAFVEAVEGLARRGRLGGLGIGFIGAFAEGTAGVDREWFGRRAAAWPFRFRVRETCTLAEAIPLASGPGRTTLLVGAGHDTMKQIQVTLGKALSAAALPHHRRFDPVALGEHLVATDALPAHDPSADLERFIETMLATPPPARRRPDVPVGFSVCILHHERPLLLAQALDSVLAQASHDLTVEIVILDNASVSPAAKAALAEATARPLVRVVALADALPYSSALNVAAEHARQPFLIFLDDDNLLAPGGLARLAAACGAGAFDVVASTLELFDEDAARPTGLATFIGPAHTAGLFYNAFGDTCMAFRRESFLAIGGFLKREGPYPCADWILLCRAQAAGLRIGVLQTPAFRYRRNLDKAAEHWQPWDRAMVRAMLLEHYGDGFDAHALAAAAQAMALELGV